METRRNPRRQRKEQQRQAQARKAEATVRAAALRPSRKTAITWQVILVAIALAMWIPALPSIDPYRLNDFGLVSVLSPAFYVSLGLLTIGFGLALRQRHMPSWVLLLYIVAFIVITRATLPLAYATPRYPWTYKHVGVVDYILRKGIVDPAIDIYFNWPGFFAFSALFTQLTGLSLYAQALWAQLFFNLLYLGPLLLLFKACSSDRRLVWLALWLFFALNWVGQDYYAPQAMGFFFYLAIVGVILTWLKAEPAGAESSRLRGGLVALRDRVLRGVTHVDGERRPANLTQYASLTAMVIVFYAAIVSSHQLTPFMTLASVLALAIFGYCRPRLLPILLAVLCSAWILYVAYTWLGVNLDWIVDSVGSVFSNAKKNLIDLSRSSVGRRTVALTCRMLTAGVFGLAILGAIRRVRKGYWDRSAAVLLIAPFPLLAAQSYGGEMLFRIYLFMLPCAAFFVAALLYPVEATLTSYRTTFLTIVLSGVLLAAFMLAHYGDEKVHYVSPADLEAAKYVYERAPRGSLVLTGTLDAPVKFEGYEQFAHQAIGDLLLDRGVTRSPSHPYTFGATEMAILEGVMADERYPAAYLLITRSDRETVNTYHIEPPGPLDIMAAKLLQSGRFVVVYANADAQVLVYKHAPAGTAQ